MTATTAIPEDLRHLFDEPALGHFSYHNNAGQIVTFPIWVDFDGERLLVSSPVGSRKGAAIRTRPDVALSIVSTSNPFSWLSASGRVIDITPDHNLEFINRMSQRYTGSAYGRPGAREVFTIEIDRLSHSGAWG